MSDLSNIKYPISNVYYQMPIRLLISDRIFRSYLSLNIEEKRHGYAASHI